MKKKILALLLILSALLSVNVFAEEKTIDPFANELFDVVGEITPEAYYEVEFSIFTDDGRLNTASPYFPLYPGLRDIDKHPYNDGIKRDFYTYTESFQYMMPDGTLSEETKDYSVSGLYDINGNCIYTDPMLEISAMSGSYVYNLGYIVHTWVDFSGDGNTIVHKSFQNTVTGTTHSFTVNECTELLNDGTFYFGVNEKYYKAMLKIPAIVTVFLNGQKMYFDQIPVIDNGRTLVPVRAIFEALGATIGWDDATKTVTATKDDTTISLTIDSTTALKNGAEMSLDVPAKIVGGRTLVPVRFVSDCFGVNVEWDPVMKKVILAR